MGVAATRGRRDEGQRLIHELAGRDGPVQRIFKRPGNTESIFGRTDKNGISGTEPVAQVSHFGRGCGAVIKMGQRPYACIDLETNMWRHKLRGSTQNGMGRGSARRLPGMARMFMVRCMVLLQIYGSTGADRKW